MAYINKVILQGIIDSVPEMKVTQRGISLYTFRLVTEDKDERREYHRLIVWDDNLKNEVSKLSTGKWISLIGSLRTRSWISKDGIKRASTEIVVKEISLIEQLDC